MKILHFHKLSTMTLKRLIFFKYKITNKIKQLLYEMRWYMKQNTMKDDH